MPKKVEGDGWSWEPRETKAGWTAIPDQAPPDESRAARRRQITAMVGKLAASEYWEGETKKLKLYPQAIRWYHDEDNGILDGAVYAITHGTNAEILVFVEARAEESGPRWVAGFARLGAAKLDVTFDEKPFWSGPSSTGGQTQSYFYYGENR